MYVIYMLNFLKWVTKKNYFILLNIKTFFDVPEKVTLGLDQGVL